MSRNDSKLPDPNRRWFDLAGRGGDFERRLADQCKGLEVLWSIVPGRDVLDLGCAEGLIAFECLTRGANVAVGLDNHGQRVAWANGEAMRRSVPAVFFQRDLDVDALPAGAWDISLALAIAHKLRRPDKFLEDVAAVTRLYIVLRLPAATGPIIVDSRSGGVAFDTRKILERVRFALFSEARGHFDEWVGYFVRKIARGDHAD